MEIETGSGRGLVPFDEPVYLEDRDDAVVVDAPSDEHSRPVLAFTSRCCVIVALAATLPFLSEADLRLTVGVLVALHLPATTALDLARVGAERARPVLSYALVVLDVGLLTGLAATADRAVLLSTVGPLVIAFHRWMYGRRAAALSVVLVTSALAMSATADVEGADWFSVCAVAVVGALLVWLVDDQALRHRQTAVGLHLVATRAEAVLDGIGDAIVSTDRSGRLRGINPAASHVLGCTNSDARGLSCHAVLGFETDAGHLECDDGCGLLDRDGSSVEVRRRGTAGTRQTMLASAVALRDPDGSIIEVVHLLRDISELKQADDAKTLFLATASHELKTPLAVISGYAQILRLPSLDEDDRRTAIDAIEARSAQLTRIVDRLLMSSRIDAGHLDLLVRAIPIDELLRDHAAAFSAATGTVECDVDDDLPHAVADHAALETVVDHLLDNAHKYSPQGGPISLRARADADWVHVDVCDTGVGMTSAQMELCFERFWQAEGTDVRRFGGTGIGLYIVQSLVHAMQGHVAVRANDGPGVTFTVSLRRTPVEVDLDSPEAVPEPSTAGEESMIREFMRQVGVLSDGGERP